MRETKYTKELLEPIVAECYSMSELLRRLGLKVTGGNAHLIGCRLRSYGISTEHFTGQAWSKGKTKDSDESLRRMARRKTLPDEEVFKLGSPCKNSTLSRRLKQKRPYRCHNCGINRWDGKDITLHVHHIDGDHYNNLLGNLVFLCPNCHQQTDNWGKKAGANGPRKRPRSRGGQKN